MAMPSIFDTVNEMTVASGSIKRASKWFIHVTSLDRFDCIKARGLDPRSDMKAPPEIERALGAAASNIVCLHPLGAEMHPYGTAIPPLFTLAVRADHLPLRVGVDWSNSPPWAENLCADAPSTAEAVAGCLRRMGSLVSYDAVEPAVLRVHCQRQSPTDPLKWTPLLETVLTDVATFDL